MVKVVNKIETGLRRLRQALELTDELPDAAVLHEAARRLELRADLITPAEAARRLGITAVSDSAARVVLKMARRGDLRAKHIGRWVMIIGASVDEFIRRDGPESI